MLEFGFLAKILSPQTTHFLYIGLFSMQGAALHDACVAMCDTMVALGMALDGGKDSLSMAAKVKGETVKAPGELVISLYAPCVGERSWEICSHN